MTKPIPNLQRFYRTGSQACPYLDGEAERKLLTELTGSNAVRLYNELSRAGFRRSHRIAYRPTCTRCAACVPVRIVAGGYAPGRSARRLTNLNADLTLAVVPAAASPEQYRLFLRYQALRHADSDMAAMTYTDYRAMIDESPLDSRLLIARDDDGALIACALIDQLDDGCSAVYSFFDPGEERRSLGTWLILQMIEHVRARGLRFVYLGYWIAGSSKMNYKIRFRPLEALGPMGWAAMETGEL